MNRPAGLVDFCGRIHADSSLGFDWMSQVCKVRRKTREREIRIVTISQMINCPPKRVRSNFNILTREHFYHVGGNEENRNPMIEAIVTNCDVPIYEYQEQKRQDQPLLLESQARYNS